MAVMQILRRAAVPLLPLALLVFIWWAIALSSVLAMNRALELMFYPIVLLIPSVPKAAIAPLVLLWMGFTPQSTIVLVALTCFFPMFVGTFIGVRAASPVLLDLFRTLDASTFKTYLHCNLPNAAGSIVASMQVGLGLCAGRLRGDGVHHGDGRRRLPDR